MARRQGGTLSGFTPLSTPNAPTIDSVSTPFGSAEVSFTAPADTGDGAITSYIVTAINESTGASFGATGSASPISVSPSPGGTFKIRMQAVNGFGPGRLSEFSTGHTVLTGLALYSWGNNAGGELGHNTPFFADTSSPVQVGALTNWSQVSAAGASSSMTAAIKTDGSLWTWGYAGSGRLGIDISSGRRSSPVQVGALTNWSQVSSGGSGAGAIKTDGTLWMWGINSSGQIGNNSTANTSSPVQVGASTDWYRLDVATSSVAAIKTDGTLWSWGSNSYGLLGDGTTVSKSSPVQIGALTNWDIVSGFFHRVAIKTDGTLWAWGLNGLGRLGDNTTINRSSPVQIGALTNWAQVSAGNAFTVAVTTSGELYTWGAGFFGRLGDNTTVDRSSPVQVGVLTNWMQINAGNYGAVAVKTDGTLWTWGRNNQGQIGDGTTIDRSSPVQVGALTTWTQASTGIYHTAAILGVP